ncbi:hypothetical protein RHGRI_035182 [Rhododendron griersonianum]|uniref:Reverse transcriptase zinc-binding domain-containing protein n=1 Tax=Rhododendron griersonianum TaxID=479676 RepID=A0AAV6I3M2_9ERIC|nr:hypothetical protein RHGRI_035182 [Rhododendron griersonianum]
MAGDLVCPVCGQSEETVEHLFFECDSARRLSRASCLGLDFTVGNPVPFKEWLLGFVCDGLFGVLGIEVFEGVSDDVE